MKKTIILSACFIFSFSFLHSQKLVSTQDLLLSYLENDIELKKFTLSAQKAELSETAAKIENGFDVNLSSGTITIKPSANGTKITAKPKAEVSVLPLSNLTLGAETNLTSTQDDTKLKDTTFSASIDIISDKNASRKVSLLKAKRSSLEAARAVNARAIAAEKEFYTELKSLLNSINSIIKAQSSYYSDTISFEQTKAKGYSSTSSTYRLAQMKVVSDQHEIESSIKELQNNYAVFYKKCGYDLELNDLSDIMNLVPQDIVETEAINVLDFDKELYTKIESAEWTNKINALERTSKKTFSLSLNGGYTLDNSTTNSDTVNGGVSGTYQGLSLSGGVSLPVGVQNADPTYTVSVGISLNSFLKSNITSKQNKISDQQELLDIQSAKNAYDTYILSAQKSLEQLEWEINTTKESSDMYEELEKDLASWYKNGIISESEYLSAKTNSDQYKLKTIINKLDVLIYNDEVKSNFVTIKSDIK